MRNAHFQMLTQKAPLPQFKTIIFANGICNILLVKETVSTLREEVKILKEINLEAHTNSTIPVLSELVVLILVFLARHRNLQLQKQLPLSEYLLGAGF